MTLPRFLKNETIPAPALTDSLEAHVEYVYKNIYSVPYSISIKYSRERKLEPRRIHGIQHVTRVAIDIPVFANLYRRYGDKEALALTNDDIKLIQIAALFHDSARKNEGIDHWDMNSAWLLYVYLTKKLGVDSAKAKVLAEAAANKDADKKYFELKITPDNKPQWVTHRGRRPKNIYQKLIHDGDSLDIMRAMDFRAEHLDFYKDIAKYNPQAFKEMAKLIREKRSLIERQGDSKGRMNLDIKKKYDHENAYRSIVADIKQFKHIYKLYDALHADNTLLSGEALQRELLPEQPVAESKTVSYQSLIAAKDNGMLFVRGISAPASVSSTRTKDEKSSAEVEAHKIYRPQGTPHRSVTLFHELYAGQGLFLEANIEDLEDVHDNDVNSGRGKKKHIEPSNLSNEEKTSKLQDLVRNVQMGGNAKTFKNGAVMAHHEILYTIKNAAAVYYTPDPNYYNKATCNDSNPCTRHAPYLQALHIKQAFENETKREFPLFECSTIHDYIKPAPRYTENQIVAMWVDSVSHIMKQMLKTVGQITEPMKTLKILAIEGTITDVRIVRKQFPADRLYAPQLADKVAEALEKAKEKCIVDHHNDVIQRIKDGTLSALDDEAFYTLQHAPHLIDQIQSQLESECERFVITKKDHSVNSFFDAIDKDYFPAVTEYNYFSSPISRIYFYAKRFNNINLMSSVQKMASYVIENKLGYYNDIENVDSFFANSYLRDLIDYSVRFNLYDDYKSRINAIINKVIDLFSKNKISHLKDLVTVLRRAGLFDDQYKRKILEIVHKNKIQYQNDADIMQALLDIEKRIEEPCDYELIPFVVKLEGGLTNPLKPAINVNSPSSMSKKRSLPENELDTQDQGKPLKIHVHSPRKSPRSTLMSPKSTSSQLDNVVYFNASPSSESKENTLRSSFHFESGMTSSKIYFQLSPSSERKETLKRTFSSEGATLRKSPRLQNVNTVQEDKSTTAQPTFETNFSKNNKRSFFSNRFRTRKNQSAENTAQTQEQSSQKKSKSRLGFNLFKNKKINIREKLNNVLNTKKSRKK